MHLGSGEDTMSGQFCILRKASFQHLHKLADARAGVNIQETPNTQSPLSGAIYRGADRRGIASCNHRSGFKSRCGKLPFQRRG